MPPHVRGDERRLRMLAEQVVALRHQLFEARKAVLRIATVREQRELEPTLVRVVDRLEELLRIGGVDEHRKPEPRARVPDRIELGVVDARGASRPASSIDRPRLFEISPTPTAPAATSASSCATAFVRPPRSDVLKVDSGENAHAVLHRRRRLRPSRSSLFEPIARHVVGDDHHADVEAVERRARARRALPRALSSPCGWPWKSMAGYFAVFTMCAGATSVDCGR